MSFYFDYNQLYIHCDNFTSIYNIPDEIFNELAIDINKDLYYFPYKNRICLFCNNYAMNFNITCHLHHF